MGMESLEITESKRKKKKNESYKNLSSDFILASYAHKTLEKKSLITRQ